MVYCDPEELKWMPYVQTWIAQHCGRLKQETREYIMEMFERYVEQGLVFVTKKCTQAMPQVTSPYQPGITVYLCYVAHEVTSHGFLSDLSYNVS